MTGGYLNLYQVNSLGAGVFPLALTVTDTLGATNRATTTLTVYNNRPFAAFTRNPVVPGPGQPVAFYAGSSSHGRPDRLIVSYAWNFGDGTQGSGQSATHTYTNPGAYSVTLTVTDNNQPPKTDTVTNALTVLGPPQFDTSPVALQLTAAGLRLTLTNLSGSGNIIVFASTNLQSWTPVLTSPPTAGSLQWTDLAVTNWPARYYRASESR